MICTLPVVDRRRTELKLLLRGAGQSAACHRDKLLCRFAIRRHRSEIVFGVLVIVFRSNRIAGPGLRLGEREIPLIISLRILRALRIGTIGCKPPGASIE